MTPRENLRQSSERPPGESVTVVALAGWFGINPGTAAVLLALYRSEGDVNAPVIRRMAGLRSVEAIKVHVSILRLAMTEGAIHTASSHYNLTRAGRDEVRDVLTNMLSEVREFLAPLVDVAA